MIKDIIKNKGEEISVLSPNDKLEYLIDLAKDCDNLEDKYKIDKNKIFGCASNLWVVGEKKSNNTIKYIFDADAFITKGTTKLVVDLLNNQLISDVANLTIQRAITTSSPHLRGKFVAIILISGKNCNHPVMTPECSFVYVS